MASSMSSQGVVLATAMAVSGTVILLALRLQKSFLTTQFPVHEISQPSAPVLRSCISSVGKKKDKKMKKRVHFADDVMDSSRNGEEFRRKLRVTSNSLHSKVHQKNHQNVGAAEVRGMPENRVALYNGILRDRVAQRLAYSY
ncbi:hypothetical protein L6164_014337 [Bauhinia variegata]|uniref:Uncharacterized protein n=1 Tax=Bauhinia variegata TaxID=167791 RepID=A0ACB9NI77_BAUVA|nr:hypothetical protein L6164_014337 [Bauhinia variegata]